MNDRKNVEDEAWKIHKALMEIHDKLRSGVIDGKEARRLERPLNKQLSALAAELKARKRDARRIK